MKRLISQLFFIVTLFCHNYNVYPAPLITFFLKPYPYNQVKSSLKLANQINKPGKLSRTNGKHILPAPISGILASYAGFLTVSNLNGEISFPRLQTRPKFNLIITTQLTPIVMSGNTISHWELEEGAPLKMYRVELTTDAQNKISFWNVMQNDELPENNIIPVESIILIADPKYIYVPLGASPYKQSTSLILPDIYIKNGINLVEPSLYMLNLAHYFGALIPSYQKDKIFYLQHLTY